MLVTKFSINFAIFTTGKNKNHFIRIRVSSMCKRVDLSTGISLQPNQWDVKRQQVKQGALVNNVPYNYINAALDDYKKFISDFFISCASRDTTPSLDELKERFARKYRMTGKEQADEFYYLYDQFLKETAKVRAWGEEMKETNTRLRNSLQKFNPNLKFADLSTSTMNAIVEHLSKTMYNDALAKRLSYFKTFIKWAQAKRYPVNEEFFAFNPKLKKAKKAVRYLELEELAKIEKLNFAPDSMLDKTRDMFVFQCYTALRFSNLKKLKHEHIHFDSATGNYSIDILTVKDEDLINFTLPNKAKEIYLKYANRTYNGGFVFPVPSNQKFNDALKKLGEKAELTGEWIDYEYRLAEMVTIKTPRADLESHTARRTFIVTAINEGVEPALIMAITGHSDYKAMMPYITRTNRGKAKVIDAINRATEQ